MMAEITTKTTQTIQTTKTQPKQSPGLKFPRYFTKPGVYPYDEVEWELRTASITDARGNSIFEQKDVESPKDWSMTAINIVASKYLHGVLGTSQRETGVPQLFQRVPETIRDWGCAQGYFATPEARDAFTEKLAHSMLQRKAPSTAPVASTV